MPPADAGARWGASHRRALRRPTRRRLEGASARRVQTGRSAARPFAAAARRHRRPVRLQRAAVARPIVWPSNRKLETTLGLARRQVQNVLNALIRANLITAGFRLRRTPTASGK